MSHWDQETYDRIYDLVIIWICERSGLPRDVVETVIGCETGFWQSHPGLWEEDDGESFCPHE